MKKTYICPSSKVYDIKAKTNILQGSIAIDSSTEMSLDNALTDRYHRGSRFDAYDE